MMKESKEIKTTNEQRILTVIEGITKSKDLKIVKEENKMFIEGDKFKLYFSIDTLSENAIIWEKLEFPMIVDARDFNDQFNSNKKKLIYKIMKEVEKAGIIIQPF